MYDAEDTAEIYLPLPVTNPAWVGIKTWMGATSGTIMQTVTVRAPIAMMRGYYVDLDFQPPPDYLGEVHEWTDVHNAILNLRGDVQYEGGWGNSTIFEWTEEGDWWYHGIPPEIHPFPPENFTGGGDELDDPAIGPPRPPKSYFVGLTPRNNAFNASGTLLSATAARSITAFSVKRIAEDFADQSTLLT